MSTLANTGEPISVVDVNHTYAVPKGPGKVALSNVSFTLSRGKFLALLGPNGAGKTTLFSLLTRLISPTDGRVQLFGHDLSRQPRRALKQLGVVFQQPTLDLDLTVAQNLAYHGALHGLPRAKVRQRMHDELARFGLEDRAHERVRSLNGGHRRRVEIARALLHEPKLLLLDEASAGLDLETRSGLYGHVRSLCRDEDVAVLWTTHLVEELDMSDDTLVLHRGKVIARDSLENLQASQGTTSANATLLALTGSGADAVTGAPHE